MLLRVRTCMAESRCLVQYLPVNNFLVGSEHRSYRKLTSAARTFVVLETDVLLITRCSVHEGHSKVYAKVSTTPIAFGPSVLFAVS